MLFPLILTVSESIDWNWIKRNLRCKSNFDAKQAETDSRLIFLPSFSMIADENRRKSSDLHQEKKAATQAENDLIELKSQLEGKSLKILF